MGFCLWRLLVSNRYRLWVALFVGGRASRLSGVASGEVYKSIGEKTTDFNRW